jgi:RNA polymerase-binding transcription factor DksA
MADTQSALEQRLREDLANAENQFHALEAEYATLLADPGAIQEDRDSTRTVLEAARGSLEQAQHAWERYERGQYGVCERCGQEISPERLEAIPDASRCVNCAT